MQNEILFFVKHQFKFDIDKDSGFNKTLWDKLKDKFYEIPGSIAGEVLKVLAIAFIIYIFLLLGINLKIIRNISSKHN